MLARFAGGAIRNEMETLVGSAIEEYCLGTEMCESRDGLNARPNLHASIALYFMENVG